METEQPIPDYLEDTYNLLRCAFPEGLRDEEYWPVMAILHWSMSFRAIADVLSIITKKHRSEVYNDASGFGLDPMPPVEEIEKVKQKLRNCGYEEWFRKDWGTDRDIWPI